MHISSFTYLTVEVGFLMTPCKASGCHTGLLAYGKCSTDLEKSPCAVSRHSGPSESMFPRQRLGLQMEPSQLPISANYRKSRRHGAKNSLEKVSKASSNFLETDKCFQDSGW